MQVVLNHTQGTPTSYPDLGDLSITIHNPSIYPTYQACFEFCLTFDACNVAIWQSSTSETSGGCYTASLATLDDLVMGGTPTQYFSIAEKITRTQPCMYTEYELICVQIYTFGQRLT